MIQRIQSVYLLIMAVLSVIVISFPAATLVGADNSITVMTTLEMKCPDGTETYQPWALFALQVISAIIALATIFMYKKRMRQIRLILFNIILLVGYYVTFAVFAFKLKGDASFVPSWTVCLPFVNIVLGWLAIRAIGKDEMLVKAYERLR